MAEDKKDASQTSAPNGKAPVVQKTKEEAMEFEGVVKECVLGKFRVEIPSQSKDGQPHVLLAQIAGKLRKFNIKIVPGDRVKVEVSPYDISKGRITYRLK